MSGLKVVIAGPISVEDNATSDTVSKWIAVPPGPYAAASDRQLWLLLNNGYSANVALPTDVQDGDVVVVKVTFSPDTGPTISSLASGVEFESPTSPGTFVSTWSFDIGFTVTRWKYSSATGIPGHAKAYLLW
jgi:hypothetical protein